MTLPVATNLVTGSNAFPAQAHPRTVGKSAVAIGFGGAVSTVDADATRVGLDVLRRGGNAVAAAVAAAATLGVTEPFSAGIAADIVRTVQHPPLASQPASSWPFPIRPGTMHLDDLRSYQVRRPAPTRIGYHDLDVYGMPTPSSGGQAVGEALNILDVFDLSSMPRTQALHHYLEASALAFADRNRYVGDHTPRALLDELLSDGFAAERACRIDPARAMAKPVAPGVPDGSYNACAATMPGAPNLEGQSTTNLTVADRWGNVVEYTLTIEQTGGNGMVVPGRGFLLNNELTDFNFTPTQGDAPDPNLPGPGKRPRSSMAPTIVLRDGSPYLAVGSPGGSTIITTVLQILVNRIDLGLSLPDAIAAARATQRNTSAVLAEAGFEPDRAALAALGHGFADSPEIGAATGIEFLPDGRIVAAAEPTRRGGGSAAVLWPVSVR